MARQFFPVTVLPFGEVNLYEAEETASLKPLPLVRLAVTRQIMHFPVELLT